MPTRANETLNRSTDSLAGFEEEGFMVVFPFTPIYGARFKAKEQGRNCCQVFQ
ncbi:MULTISPECIES: hypothetical protein [unclassified Colwellia]|uniref:hypothetical protein n=1 Tax=unclassified Colwellia TaxID=196834 RepID=UPI0015F65EC3|nr:MULTISPECIES: hypothetical protein [unclassified Colwellia]MBA6234102.1 hypothetical protein [Colwellia sp. MB02u-7]MBA6237976.1 hypothetical protein [Colwellia sp. MB02u-11]MBA6257711.1 hypothetical protein [Colwellia sp. MB3u-28]MBA6259468.1 hypothetical protein [Colwellia sp. MB3u-41]MBA6300776.1 hypothetical protein [Colwellia sp. MB3u-22]